MPARAAHGFGPRPIFFEVLKPHFELPQNAERLVTVLLGSACEQWINGELFLALNASRLALAVVPEREKRDLVLYSLNDRKTPRLVIETKLIYSTYGESKQRCKLLELRLQLEESRVRYPNTPAVGLVVSFFWRESSTRVSPPERMPRGSFNRIGGLENVFGHEGPYNVTAPRRVAVAGREFDVLASMEMVRAC
jgi:hypothetical protein